MNRSDFDERINYLINKYSGDKSKNKIKQKIEFAWRIIESIDKQLDVKLNFVDNAVSIMPSDDHYGNYSMKILSFKQGDITPVVSNLDDGTEYRWKNTYSVNNERRFADLFSNVLSGKDDSIEVLPKTDNEKFIGQSNSELKDLINSKLSYKREYYETDKNKKKITKVNPYLILKDLKVIDKEFETDLRRLIKQSIKGKSLEKKREFLKVDNNSINSIKDAIDSLNYNNLLINECIEFDENCKKSINNAKENEEFIGQPNRKLKELINSLEEKRKFLKVDNNSINSIKDAIDSLNYNNLLINECIEFDENCKKSINDAKEYEEFIGQSNSELKDLINSKLSYKREYYETDKNKKKITKVNPYLILKDLKVIDKEFETDLRRLIKQSIKGKSLEKKRKFLKVDNNSINSIKDAIDSLNYNNLLINECIEFDEAHSLTLDDVSGLKKEILEYVKETLIKEDFKIDELEIRIDEHGIVRYSGEKNGYRINGYVGQVFLPDDPDIQFIKTRFYVDETNYWFVPEYKAILDKRKGDSDRSSFEKRTKLRSYKDTIKKEIHLQIRKNLKSNTGNTATGINYIYKRLYKERFNYDFLADKVDTAKNALPLDIRIDIVKTLQFKVKYSDYYAEKYGVNYLVGGDEKKNDYFNENENILVIGEGSKGFFDPEATSSGQDQGSIRYLVAGAQVQEGGIIERSNDENDRTPIFKNDFLNKYSQYNPSDRNQMVFSNLMRAYSITEPVETALTTCGGWNMEDGFVVSKKFADKYQVPGKDGNLRPLMIGDKMLDRGGNKGVISVIVNPGDNDLPENLRQIFNENPNLDVIASPYSGLSRYNGATAREMMDDDDRSDLTYDGKEYKNCIGKVRFIITAQFADKKTKIYDEEDYKEGDSRKASPQLSWALCAKDAKKMLEYFYSKPERSKEDVEYYYDILRAVFHFDMPRLEEINKKIKLGSINDKKTEEILSDDNGQWYELRDDSNKEDPFYFYVLPRYAREGYTDYAGRYIESDVSKNYRYMLRSRKIEKTKEYYQIIKTELRKQLTGEDNIIKKRVMTRAVANSSTAIWTPDPRLSVESIAISEDIANELGVNEPGVNEDGDNEWDYLLIWRDPILRDANVRYMKVERVDPNLTGIAINPVMAKGFDGDFDGDTVAVVKIDAKKYNDVHKEAIEKFSVENNLYDEGKTGKPLIINTGLDLVSAGADFEKKKDVKSIDNELKNTFEKDYCLENAMIKLTNDNTVIKSLQTIYDSGAKKGDIKNYEKYFKNTKNDLDDKERIEVQKATAIKAYVGVAGRYSQQLMRAFRDVCPKAVLELTYPNTQALLQAKHDPGRAKEVYKILQNDLMDEFDRYLLKELLTDEEKNDLEERKKDLESHKKEGEEGTYCEKYKELQEKLKEYNINLKDRWSKKRQDEQNRIIGERKENIKNIYQELDQPIGDKGINKEYLDDVCDELGKDSLKLKKGSMLDELAYGTKTSARGLTKKKLFEGKYTQYFNCSDHKSNDKEQDNLDNDNSR